MPEIVIATLLYCLTASLTIVRDLMFRWYSSIRLIRYFQDLTLVLESRRIQSRTRPGRGRIGIERDDFWLLRPMLGGILEKCFCSRHVAFGAQHAVYRPCGPLHRPMVVDTLSADLQVRSSTPTSVREAETVPSCTNSGVYAAPNAGSSCSRVPNPEQPSFRHDLAGYLVAATIQSILPGCNRLTCAEVRAGCWISIDI
jgi:hypothetical protein